MKVIISTFGPLHLVKGATFLNNIVDIQLIQGWAPKSVYKPILTFLEKLSGRKNLELALKKRIPQELNDKVKSCSISEFIIWLLFLFSKHTGLINRGQAARIGWKIYGLESCRFLEKADIFHVRSGGGGTAIEHAKNIGMKVIVDHSIAHPAFLIKQLTPEFEKYGLCYKDSPDFGLSDSYVRDMEQADIIIVNSQFVKQTMIAENIYPEKIKVVTQGVREDFWGIKKNYKIDEKVKILFTGGFSIRKGAEYFLEAMKKMELLGINCEAMVVGSYDEVCTIINNNKPTNIVFTGPVPQDVLKKYFIESDIYLFPTLAEGCASSGLEAMAAGMPVVTTIESGLPIQDHVDGVIIPSKNPDAIVEALLFLKMNNKIRESIGLNASKKIREQYTWELYAENIAKLYDNLILNK